jgi:hypothetical protein
LREIVDKLLMQKSLKDLLIYLSFILIVGCMQTGKIELLPEKDYSPSSSIISISASTVASGSSVTLTLISHSLSNTPRGIGGLKVGFSQMNGTSTGVITRASDNGDGTYTATFTGIAAGTATEIHAFIYGNPVTSGNPTLIVTAGPPTSIVLSSGNSQIDNVGRALDPYVVVVRDANSNLVPNALIDWVVTSGSGELLSASNLTDASGISSNTLTVTLPGTAATSATVSGTSLSANFSASADWDTDAAAYFARMVTAGGGTDPMAQLDKQRVNGFIVGLKDLSLYDDVLEMWFLRSGQNIGSGTTVYGFKDFKSGSLVNGPAWHADGVDFTQSWHIMPAPNLGTDLRVDKTFFHITKINNTSSGAYYTYFSVHSRNDPFDTNNRCILFHQGTGNGALGITQPFIELVSDNYTNRPGFVGLVAGVGNSLDVTFRSIGGANQTVSTTVNARSGTGVVDTFVINSDREGGNGVLQQAALSIVFNRRLNVNAENDVYALIKATVGQGLGLP